MNVVVILYVVAALAWLVGALGAFFGYRAFKQNADVVAMLGFLVLAIERGWRAWGALQIVTLDSAAPEVLLAGLIAVGAALVVVASRMRRVVVI